ncbi:caspase family protein [Fischerella sp. JS2]|uniref:caspase family protein n=1 Tax=Fischerella sp. JS2 TaxID=2597771 RepID=UPI0028E27299|nr:caspase family protein [Fischerella sp. JS2]
MEARLKQICDAVQPDDLLWVHFACHGIVVKTAGNHKEPVLITCDTQRNLLEQQALPVAKVEQYMKGSRARRLLLTLDACHTGLDIGRDLLADPEFIHNVYEQAEGFALIAASTAQQKAFEWQEKQHGVFTYNLLEGLSGQADRAGKNFVTVDDLKNHVLDGLRRWGVKNDVLQEPTARTEGLGDMILADYRDNPKQQTKSGGSDVSQANKLEKQQLQQEFDSLSEEYMVVNKQLRQALNARERLLLNKQADDILQQMKEIEAKLK